MDEINLEDVLCSHIKSDVPLCKCPEMRERIHRDKNKSQIVLNEVF